MGLDLCYLSQNLYVSFSYRHGAVVLHIQGLQLLTLVGLTWALLLWKPRDNSDQISYAVEAEKTP